MRKAVLAICLTMMLMPVWAEAQGLPKCRNVAGYEPKAVCEARNQRATWQANETARLTGELFERALAEQAAENRANQKGFMDQISGFLKSAEKTIKGFF
jgi:hypothetical protein